MAAEDDVNRELREFKRYTGDGLPNEPTGAALPIGDPSSGIHNPKKSGLRAMLLSVLNRAQQILDDAVAIIVPDDGVSTIKIQDGAVTEPKLAAEAVTDEKVAGAYKAKIMGVAADRTALASMSGDTYLAVDLMESGRKGLFMWNGSDLSGTILGDAVTSTAVDAGTDTVTSAGHGLWTGQPVIATTAVNGLVLQTVYYVIRVDADDYKLAGTHADALDGLALNLTGTTNFTVRLHRDPTQAVYVTAAGDITGATGAWERQFDGRIHATWGGLTSAGDEKDNIFIINSAIRLADELGCGVELPGYQFDVYAGGWGGIVVMSNTHLRGKGRRRTILNTVGGGSISELRNYQAGSVIRRDFDFTGGTNEYVQDALIEKMAIVLNHPGDSVTTTAIQIGVDLRNVTRSIVRECHLGNYHPDPTIDAKGFTRPYLAQGYFVVCGNESGDVSYAGGEVNVITDNFMAGAWRGVCIDDNQLNPVSAAYSQRIERNDIQIAQILVYQANQYGAGNVIRDNTLQACQAKQGDVSGTFGIFIEGYGNLIEEAYGEYGNDCQWILWLGGASNNNRAKYSGTCSVTGGLATVSGHYGFRDAGGGSSFNVVEFFADTAGGGAFNSAGSPQRMISGTATTQS